MKYVINKEFAQASPQHYGDSSILKNPTIKMPYQPGTAGHPAFLTGSGISNPTTSSTSVQNHTC